MCSSDLYCGKGPVNARVEELLWGWTFGVEVVGVVGSDDNGWYDGMDVSVCFDRYYSLFRSRFIADGDSSDRKSVV